MYSFDKRTVSRTGIASLGWSLGRGYVREKLTVKSNVWCVLHNDTVIAECRSKQVAYAIYLSLTKGMTFP